ncbi:hypothetical protein ASE05_11285 [Mesorhizobium sp. Root172]|uniref:Uncharacterized protein n=1 Tax=Rhizobium loti TaxID=381 RepID=A0AA91F5H5_RHILI|nr:hypothetical protein ASE05_11285 [Mesorhizobium sp. Root172]OBQ66563.1 hypothetical protein A8145_29460 [Mesorhizobium loti]
MRCGLQGNVGRDRTGAGTARGEIVAWPRDPADAAALLPDGLTGLDPHLASSLPAAIRDVVFGRYSSGFNVMFLWVAALYFVAMALTLPLEDVQIPKRG